MIEYYCMYLTKYTIGIIQSIIVVAYHNKYTPSFIIISS